MHKIKLFVTLILLALQISGFDCAAQKSSHTKVTQSKSCGSCGKSVSVNSTVGMRCPHCGVIWGSENTTKTHSKSYGTYNNYDNINWGNNIGYSNTQCICGRYKNANEIFCHKCKTTCVCGRYKDENEVFCMKCRTTCVCGRKKSANDVFCFKCQTTCICGRYKNPNDVFCKNCKYNYKTSF